MFFQPSAIPNNAQVVPLAPTTPLPISLTIRRPLSPDGISVKEHAKGVIAGTHSILTIAEFADKFGASQEDHDIVTTFAQQIGATVGISHTTAAIVSLSGTAEIFNNAFGIELHEVITPEKTYISYSGTLIIPPMLDGIIVNISGLDYSNEPIRRSNIQKIVSTELTPSSLFGNYNTPIGSPQAAATAYKFPGKNNGNDGVGQIVGLIEPFGSCGYTIQNLNSIFGGFGLPVPTVISYPYITPNPFGVTVINDPNGPASPEVALDIAAVGGIVPKATIVVYITATELDAYNCALYDLKGLGYFPSVLSMSYAAPWPRYGTLFAEATTLGVTLVAASGDWGVYNAPQGRAYRALSVPYPAADEHSLAVGGTSLAINPNGSRASEVTWNDGYDYAITGGGQSTIIPVPTWQTGLTIKDYATGVVTALTGRGVPDVAFNADGNTGFPVYYGTGNYQFSANGTSSAAPHWAGLIARLNEITGSRVGFINDVLYQHPEVFNNITVGDNNESGVGYSATAGWDACTGLGTPKGTAILALFGGAGLPSDNTLSNLTITDNLGNTVTLTPTFNGSTLDYSGYVGGTITSITVTPTTNDPSATLYVNGNDATSGQPVTVTL